MSTRKYLWLIYITGFIFAANSPVFAEQFPIIVRAENIIVPPSTGPNTNIILKNQGGVLFEGKIKVQYPQNWIVSPEVTDISLNPDETRKISLTIDKAIDLKSNTYPVEITVNSGDKKKIFKQKVYAATSPFFEPKIDSNLKDWKPAVPVTFKTGDRKTVFATGWNKKNFNIAVEVQEDKLTGYRPKSEKPIDAVQIAIAPRKTQTPESADRKAQRYEFLLVDSPGFFSSDKCFLLMQPGDDISVATKERDLAPLLLKEAKVSVKRKKNITVYECSIPFSVMPKIKAMTGRDFQMSMLVHDPDGTGIRDMGQACGLWQSQRNKFAWSLWKGIKKEKQPHFDSKLEWGFSTSKY